MSKFTIDGREQGKARLTASEALTPGDFDDIARQLGEKPRRARKVGLVAARMVREATEVVTDWESERTTASAKPGDWLVTNLHRNRYPLRDSQERLNRYRVTAERFPELYKRIPGETEDGPLFAPRTETVVDCLPLPGGLDIVAPWGQRQRMGSCYLLRNGADVYGNDQLSFAGTYEITG